MIDETNDIEKIHKIDGTYGIYNGEAHKIDIDSKGDLYMSPNSDSEIDDTYVERFNKGHYYKKIASSDISEAYKLRSYAEYKGYEIEIIYTYDDWYELYLDGCDGSEREIAQKLDFKELNRAEFYLRVKKTDVKPFFKKTPLDLEAIIARRKELCAMEEQKRQASRKKHIWDNKYVKTVLFVAADILLLCAVAVEIYFISKQS